MTFASIAVLFHFFVSNEVSLWHLPTSVYLYGFLMAIFSTVLPSYLVATAISKIGSGNVAVVGSVGPVSTILLATIFLEEKITLWQIVGTTLILVGVLIIGHQK
jgi:drug/metabolite transporter (DMT)-like permease